MMYRVGEGSVFEAEPSPSPGPSVVRLFRGDSTLVVRPVQPGGGGSIPTSPLHKSEWFVSGCTMRQLREMIGREHYAGRGGITAVYRFGLYRKSDMWCAGVSWWIPPARGAAGAAFEGDFRRVLALHRLACHANAPKNAASFLIRHSVNIIRKAGRFDCLLTFADTAQNHTGQIYHATGWEYCGLVAGDNTWHDAEGFTVARTTAGRGRKISEMEAAGLRPVGRFDKHKFRMMLRPSVPQPKRQPALGDLLNTDAAQDNSIRGGR